MTSPYPVNFSANISIDILIVIIYLTLFESVENSLKHFAIYFLQLILKALGVKLDEIRLNHPNRKVLYSVGKPTYEYVMTLLKQSRKSWIQGKQTQNLLKNTFLQNNIN